MSNFPDIAEACEAVGSRLEKERILKDLDPLGQRLMMLALDPAITFGVTVDEDKLPDCTTGARMITRQFWPQVELLANELRSRELTGNNALGRVELVLTQAPDFFAQKWTARLLNKNLRCGVHVSTVNKVFFGLVEPFAVALAKPYDPARHDMRGSWIVEPKLDGLRMVVIDGVAYTRNGRVIDAAPHVLARLREIDPLDKFVFDGEVMGSGDFDESSGQIRRKSVTNEGIYYNVFDVIRRDEWSFKRTAPLSDRKNLLLELMVSDNKGAVRVVDWVGMTPDPTTAELFEIRDEFITRGYEGAMLKDLNSPYVFKRSDSLLKLKDFTDADCTVVGSYEGKGKLKGMLGGLELSLDGGATCRVGSGFSEEQRAKLWIERASLPGRVVEIQYQNKTAEGSLRFPVFIKFRPDKE